MTLKDVTLGAYRSLLGITSAIVIFFSIRLVDVQATHTTLLKDIDRDIAVLTEQMLTQTAANTRQDGLLSEFRENIHNLALAQAVMQQQIQNLEDRGF